VVLRGDLYASQVSLAAFHGCDEDMILQHAFAIKYYFYCVIQWMHVSVCLVLWKKLHFTLFHNCFLQSPKLQSTNKNYDHELYTHKQFVIFYIYLLMQKPPSAI